MFDTTSTLKLPLFLMALGGVNPLKRGFLSSFSYAIGFIATVPLFFLSFLDYYLTPNTITNFAQKLEGNMTFGQVVLKGFILTYFKEDLADLLNKIYAFKKFKGVEQELENEIKSLVEKEMKSSKWYLSAVSFSLLFFIGKPFFPGHELPLRCYVPNVFYLSYNVVFFVEIIMIIYIIFVVIAHDILFSSICLQVTIQFKLLGNEMKNLNLDKYSTEGEKIIFGQIKNCVIYHEYLIDFVRKIQKIYSLMFLTQILITTGTLCMELYISSVTSATNLGLVKNLTYAICLLFELSYYCFPADILTEEARNIANSIFTSNWYYSKKQLRIFVQMIIMRAQKENKFSAGGLAYVNRETLSNVFKASYSLLTVMKRQQM